MRSHPGLPTRFGGAALFAAGLSPPDSISAAPPDRTESTSTALRPRPAVAPSQASTAALLPEASPTVPLLPGVCAQRQPSSRPDPTIHAVVESLHCCIQAAHTMERSPMATPPEIEEGFSSGSPVARTPVVEVIMPMPRISPTAKQSRVSTTHLARNDRMKRARCAVGSPTLRIISQMQFSARTTSRSPASTTTQNPCAPSPEKLILQVVEQPVYKTLMVAEHGRDQTENHLEEEPLFLSD